MHFDQMVLSADNTSTPPDTLTQADSFADKPEEDLYSGDLLFFGSVM